MKFEVSCEDGHWHAKTLNQALTIKHAHMYTFENHDVKILDDGGNRIELIQEDGGR